METVKQGPARPQDILNGHDMNQDIHQLLGYVWQNGMLSNERTIFPSDHLAAIGEEFLRKYRTLEIQSPKAQLNSAHTIKRAALQLESTVTQLNKVTEKLDIHEHYMNVMGQLDRSKGLLSGKGESLSWELASIAERMRGEAEEAMKKPESFDDIEDDWTAKGNGTSEIQKQGTLL